MFFVSKIQNFIKRGFSKLKFMTETGIPLRGNKGYA